VPVSEDQSPPAFRLLIVPGVTINRWSRTWAERVPGVPLLRVPAEAARAASLLAGEVDAGIVRLPVDRDALDAIPLYTEVTVVLVPRDHLFAAADELTMADLAGEALLWPRDDVLAWTGTPAAPAATVADRPATTAEAVELVAAGTGVLVVPQSLARAHHRRDLIYRTVTDAPASSVALAWARDRYTDLVEEMIGIVRGRTANSTRGRSGRPGSAAASAPAGDRAARSQAGSGTSGRSGSTRRRPRRGR
jgi:DNA-binding transcriptional LysR family regulator